MYFLDRPSQAPEQKAFDPRLQKYCLNGLLHGMQSKPFGITKDQRVRYQWLLTPRLLENQPRLASRAALGLGGQLLALEPVLEHCMPPPT